jgi:hypothetical protein
MGWNYRTIEHTRREAVAARFAAASRDELLARIVALETALYPYWTALSPVLDKSWCGTSATSKLFPLRPDDTDKFYVFNKDTKEIEAVDIDEDKLTDTEYCLDDSIHISDGSKFGDNFTLLSFHQQAPGAYVGNGSIDIADVKRAGQILNEPYQDPAHDKR